MKKYLPYILGSLLISLYIYLFYRTPSTVVSQIFISLTSLEYYESLKNTLQIQVPLPGVVIYSLPEGMWVFSITLISKNLYLKIGRTQINCVYFPIVYVVFMEICQLLHILNGRFDWFDILISSFFWMLAYFGFKRTLPEKKFVHAFDVRTVICIATYAMVYLAHVMI